MENLSAKASPRKPFSRTSSQLRVLQQRGRNRPAGFAGAGVRTDRRWARDRDALEADERTNIDLVNAIEWLHARRGARPTSADRQTLASLKNRSWGFEELSACHMRALPSWLADRLPSRLGRGFGDFVGLVLSAYRSGAAGVLVSYSEGMAITQVRSESTWRAWTQRMEDLGLVRMVQTWVEDPTGERTRLHGRLLYAIGPAVLEWGAGAELEAALDRGKRDMAARGAAIAARKLQRQRDEARLDATMARRAPHNDPRRRPSQLKTPPAQETRVETKTESVSKNPNRTPLRDCDDCNVFPSFVGGNTTPPAVGDQKGATGGKPPVAACSGEAAPPSASRPPAEMLAELFTRLGARPSEIERLTGIPQRKPVTPKPGGPNGACPGPSCPEPARRPPAESPPDVKAGLSLFGPLARELSEMAFTPHSKKRH
jgi:hypothetical protein